ncbi:MAG: hypothetical protein AAFV29_23180 [Myxococcota bacterium]
MPRSLQAMIDAGVGDTLVLPEGRFGGPAVVRRPLRIVGAGPDRTVIVGDGPLLSSAGTAASLQALSLAGASLPTGRGAAIHVASGRVEIVDCVIEGHRAVMGGAVYVAASGTLSMRRVRLIGNRASKGGGAIAIIGGGRAKLSQVSFEDNRAADAGHHLYAMRVGSRVPQIQLTSVTFSACLGRSTGIANVRGFEGRFTLIDTEWPADSLKVPQR